MKVKVFRVEYIYSKFRLVARLAPVSPFLCMRLCAVHWTTKPGWKARKIWLYHHSLCTFSPPQTSYTSALALAQETISANIYSLECFFVAISTASKYIIIVCVSFREENERERELKEFVKLLLVLPTSLMLLFNDILLHQGFNAALKHLVVSEKSKWALHASCFYQFIRHMSLAFSDFFSRLFQFYWFSTF